MKKITFLMLILFLLSSCAPKTTCNKPYILIGLGCCLDKNDNKICDNHETQEVLKKEIETEEPIEDIAKNLPEEPKEKTEEKNKIEVNPLGFQDLEYIDIGGLDIIKYGYDDAITFAIYGHTDKYRQEIKGSFTLDRSIYADLNEYNYSKITSISITTRHSLTLDIIQGEYITLIYDGGKKTDIFLPSIDKKSLESIPLGDGNFMYMIELFISEDGDTYYDKELNSLVG